ncbi:MAG: sigma-70 family RNA polymerase sigma factor [Nitrospinae bacterium]|nr:sigma-70 family RNA polymerase sigma factor [Nitrospinota bacterium]
MGDIDKEFLELYKTFQPAILRYLTRLVGEHEAEDLTQEVFIRIRQSLDSFRGDSSLSTWVYKIATNAALDKLRSPSFRKTVYDEPLAPDSPVAEQAPSADRLLIRKEMNDCIRNFIENLPDKYRVVVVLSELEDKKNGEIAEILGITLDTVKIRLHRAKEKLKEELGSHCSFYQDRENGFSCDLKVSLKMTK